VQERRQGRGEEGAERCGVRDTANGRDGELFPDPIIVP